MSEESATGVTKLKAMFARGDLFSPPSTYVVTGQSPGRRHPRDDGIMRVTDVCDWRGVRVDVRTRRCGRELLGYIMAISPYGDQTLPLESVSAMVNPARVVSSPVFLQLSCEQMRTVVRYLSQISLPVKNERCFAPLPPKLMVNPARVVGPPVFLQLSCQQLRTLVW